MSEHTSTKQIDADTRDLLIKRHAELVGELNDVLAELQRVRAACSSRTWSRARVAALKTRSAQLQTRSEELTAIIHHLSAAMAGRDVDLETTTTPLRDTARSQRRTTPFETDSLEDESMDKETLAGLTISELRKLSIQHSERLTQVEGQIHQWHEQLDRSQGSSHLGESTTHLRQLERRREQLNKRLDDIADAMLQAEEEELWQPCVQPAEHVRHSCPDSDSAAPWNTNLTEHLQRSSEKDVLSGVHAEASVHSSEQMDKLPRLWPSRNPTYSSARRSLAETSTATPTASMSAVDTTLAPSHPNELEDRYSLSATPGRRARSVSPSNRVSDPQVSESCVHWLSELPGKAAAQRMFLLDSPSANRSKDVRADRSARSFVTKYSNESVQQRVEQARQRLAQRGESLQHVHKQSAAMYDEASAFEDLTGRLANKHRLPGGRFWESLF